MVSFMADQTPGESNGVVESGRDESGGTGRRDMTMPIDQVVLRGGPMDGLVTKGSESKFIAFGVGGSGGPDGGCYAEVHYSRTDEVEAGLQVWAYVAP
jgi:hypothetical protein